MLRTLFLFMIAPILFCGQVCSLPDWLYNASDIKGYNNGQEIVIEDTQKVKDLISELFKNSRPMPAYCVSLDKDTKLSMQEGIWLEFEFGKTYVCDDMPFDTLLFQVDRLSSGVNLIRGNDGKFEGRCYYFDLEGDMSHLYDHLIALETKTPQEEEKIEVELEAGENSDEVQEESENTSDDDSRDASTIPSVPKDKDENSQGVI